MYCFFHVISQLPLAQAMVVLLDVTLYSATHR